MPKTKLEELSELGQSIWLDYISRPLLESGRLKSLIDLGLRGMTSNPSIFNQAISGSNDYDEKILRLSSSGKSIFEIYDELTIRDVQEAADFFEPVYLGSHRLDGYVSLEINPHLANQTVESIREGKRLYEKVNRPNVMIKVPATPAGFPVIEELLADGISVNVTLIFSLEQYIQTAEAFIRGMNRLMQKGGDLSQVRSVASVFVSRIDTAIDKILEIKILEAGEESTQSHLRSLRGKAAVANSQMIFAKFKEIFSGDRFQPLVRNKAEVQRVLWASTGTKNPHYSDVKYVTELIGRPTVNTVPEKTLEAFLDHGVTKETLSGNKDDAQAALNALREIGIDVDSICQDLLKEGVTAFEKSFTELLTSIESKAQSLAIQS